MFRKAFLSLVATAALGTGIMAMTPAAEAHHRHHHNSHITLGFFPFFGYPSYRYRDPLFFDDYYGYEDCGYQWVPVKRWNKSHTHRIIVHRKRWVCY